MSTEKCYRCGEPITLSGSNSEVDGCYENVALSAASGGLMAPVHWKCLSYSMSSSRDRAWLAEEPTPVIDEARALKSVPNAQGETAKQQFDDTQLDENTTPLERLRYFCSIAMSGQDWLDVEPFFAALESLPARPPEGWQMVPKEPTIELLVSMALRVNHGFGLDDERSKEVQISDMRKAYEEVVGAGFYRDERKEYYRSVLAAAQPPVAPKGEG